MIRPHSALPLCLAALFFAPASPREQQPPDMFTCADASRLATGTFTYQNDAAPDRPHIRRTVSRVDAGGRRIVRVAWVTATPSEQVTDLDASTLQPLRTQMTRTSPSGASSSALLEVVNNEVRGKLVPTSDAIAVPTGGRPVVFGPYVLELLAGAVDWERCPAVSAAILSDARIETAVLTRAEAASLTVAGSTIAAITIDVARHDGMRRIWLSEAAPRVPLKFTGSMGSSSMSLVSR